MATVVKGLRADPAEVTPRLSWIVESDTPGSGQGAYEIVAQDLDTAAETTTGVVESDQSLLVPWPFDPLGARARRRVRVRVTSAAGELSAWCDPLDLEVGLVDPSDWVAVAITATFPGEAPERPIRFRRTFSVRAGLVRARLYASALGIYTAECNGWSIGQDVLAPGWTSYRHRLRYQTYDVTDLLDVGANVLGITVAEGWYRGRVGFRGGRREIYGADIGPIAQLELHYADGTRDTVTTDRHWRAGLGPHVSASLYDGETYDARLADPAWSTPGFDDREWDEVRELGPVAHLMAAPTGPPVRRIETLRPVRIFASPAGATLVDFGQNISGRVRFTVQGQAGDVVTVRHAEVLEHGELGTRPLRGAAATDTYVLAGDEAEVYEPTFTIHGFRYVEVEGWPGELVADAIEAVVCHSDMEPTGSFRSSHDGLNRLHDNVRWSMRGNFVDLPTDCPQRDERLGWTGDIQVFAPTASFLYDAKGFLVSWLQDLAAEQAEHGTVPQYVPWIELAFPARPAAAWGDAAVVVPWVLYERFGDAEVLGRQYDSMRAWVDQVTELAGDDLLWDKGFQFGDWLDPAAPPDDPSAARTDPALIATAYHAYTARLVARTAAVLGDQAAHEQYNLLADGVVAAFNAEFVMRTGRLTSDAQTAYAVALRFGLLRTEAQRARAARRLAALVREEGYRIGTGFVGTPLVCDALVDAGLVDEAYLLLLQDRCPSWLYPVSMGATTVWERWDSMLPDGTINPGEMTSFNHYALGAVGDFLQRVVGGLAPGEPGYRTLLVRPRPGGGLTEAGAALRTPYGDASVRWHRKEDWLVVDLVVPVGSTARVDLPGQAVVDVDSGRHRFACPTALQPSTPSTHHQPRGNSPPHTKPEAMTHRCGRTVAVGHCLSLASRSAIASGRGTRPALCEHVRAVSDRHLVPAERRRRILELLRARGSLAVADVEEGFGVSAMTARRDLALLADEGRVRRTHGGAVLPELAGHEDSFGSRFDQDVEEKRRLAQAVVATLQPSETVFLDSSSTAHYVLRAVLEARLAVTLVTNSLPAMAAVGSAEAANVELIGLGGGLRKLTRSFVGAETVRAIRNVFVDRLVFSVKGIESGGYLTDPDPLEAEVKRAMIERARTVVLLAGAQKFDEGGLHVISHASNVHIAYLADPPPAGVRALEDAGVVVHRI